MYFLRFAYFNLFYFFIPVFILLIIYKIKFYKSPVYKYSLLKFLESNAVKNKFHKKVLFIIRFLILLLLIILIARPQWVDSKSNINVDGVDIILTIDVSGSMQVFDDLRDRRSRIEVAKKEAIRFIEKRIDDPIGVVIFAKDTISLCPLTIDKKILKDVVSKLELGFIDPKGTSLGTGLAISVNRLRKSKAKSKIIILLTDGIPTPGEKISPKKAIELAKEYNIKIYTVGIGNKKGGFFEHPFLGIQRTDEALDVNLLKEIAQKTDGKFFRANNPKEMRDIYDRIDKLEKTKIKTNIFNKYYEAFLSFVWILLLLLGLEFLLKLTVWKSLYN
ncbi:VWA domain-containing protein [Candidatus Dependentiae bacterium]|nr:VWA domain-containing protein [Candidatus Dependentiae bacterium]